MDARSIATHHRYLDRLRTDARYDQMLIEASLREISESLAALRIADTIQSEMLPNGRERDMPSQGKLAGSASIREPPQ
jgi:hypothetical protein